MLLCSALPWGLLPPSLSLSSHPLPSLSLFALLSVPHKLPAHAFSACQHAMHMHCARAGATPTLTARNTFAPAAPAGRPSCASTPSSTGATQTCGASCARVTCPTAAFTTRGTPVWEACTTRCQTGAGRGGRVCVSVECVGALARSQPCGKHVHAPRLHWLLSWLLLHAAVNTAVSVPCCLPLGPIPSNPPTHQRAAQG